LDGKKIGVAQSATSKKAIQEQAKGRDNKISTPAIQMARELATIFRTIFLYISSL